MTLPFEPLDPVPPGHFREAAMALSPPWLSGYWGARLMYSLGIQQDAIAEYFRIGALQRFPDYCQAEALTYIGNDRRLPRGPTEPEAAYRARLKAWLTAWKYAGHPKSVLGQLAAYFSPTPPVMRYVSNGYDDAGNTVSDWWTLSGGVYTYHRATPANWNWDNNFGNFRFWIILYVPLLSGWNWDDGHTWNQPGLLWDYSGGQFVADVWAIVNKWKASGSHMGNLILASNTTQQYTAWGSGGLVWNGWNWGQSVSAPMFNPSAVAGSPMPNGTWGDEANRDPNAQYLAGL